MTSQAPTPATWTLKFKRDRMTIVLFVHPDQSFTSIKQDFLDALKARNITTFDDQAVPDSIEEVTFAKLIVPNDPDSGWEVLATEAAPGPKKGRPSTGGSSPSKLLVKDGATLAFKFGRLADDEDGAMEARQGGFNVVFPSLDIEEPDQLST